MGSAAGTHQAGKLGSRLEPKKDTHLPTMMLGCVNGLAAPKQAELWDGRDFAHLGNYGTEEAAARAYDRACLQQHGAEANTNYPPSVRLPALSPRESLHDSTHRCWGCLGARCLLVGPAEIAACERFLKQLGCSFACCLWTAFRVVSWHGLTVHALLIKAVTATWLPCPQSCRHCWGLHRSAWVLHALWKTSTCLLTR